MLLIIILVGCNAEPSLHEFPIIETLTPTIVDSTGATFHGRLIKQGTDLISSYGFVWGIADVHQSIADSIILGSGIDEIDFGKRIDFSLSKGFNYYVRIFARYRQKIIYGNPQYFISKGSTKCPWELVKNVYLDGYFNSIGSSDNNYGHILFQNSSHYIYNPQTNEFTKSVKTPIDGNSGTLECSVNVGNALYLFSSETTNLYKLENNTWSIESQRPFGYDSFWSFSFSLSDSLIYFLSSNLYAYNLKTKRWSQKASYNWGGIEGCTTLNKKLYTMNFGKEIYEYDPTTNLWLKITSYPGKLRNRIITFSYGTKIYIGLAHDGAYSEDNWFEKEIWSYDIGNRVWKRCNDFPYLLTDGAHDLFFFNYQNSLYFGYGTSSYTVWKFDVTKE